MSEVREGRPTPAPLPPGPGAAREAERPARIFLPRIVGMDTTDQHPQPLLSNKGSPPRCASSQLATTSKPTNSNAAPTMPSTTTSFKAINAAQRKKLAIKKAQEASTLRSLAALAPAPARPPRHSPTSAQREIAPQPPPQSQAQDRGKTLFDIPAEIRVEIYKLALESVTIHILPRNAGADRRSPHALTRTSRLVRNEVLPIIHATCAIVAVVNDFNFSPILEFLSRIPAHEQKALTKNPRLKIQLCTTSEKCKGGGGAAVSDSASLRRWLALRADRCRFQPEWEYVGVWPGRKVESDIRRRVKRMTEQGKKRELVRLAEAMGLSRLEGGKKGDEA